MRSTRFTRNCTGKASARSKSLAIGQSAPHSLIALIGEGGILALGAAGIQVNPNDDTAHLLKSAIEARTKIKVDVSGIPRQAGDLNPTMLVIGPKPKYEKYFSTKPSEAGAGDVVSPVADELQDP